MNKREKNIEDEDEIFFSDTRSKHIAEKEALKDKPQQFNWFWMVPLITVPIIPLCML